MDKALNYLSLARKGGMAELGEEPAGAAARAGKAYLLLVAEDASDHTWRRALSFAAGTDIIAQLAQKTGKPAPAPLAGLAGKAVRFTDVTGKDEMTQVVTEFLRA